MVERAVALCALLFLAACSGTADLRKAELAELAGWLPGNYEGADASIAFVPIYAPFISDNVFFTEETRLRAGRGEVSQRIVAFEVIDKQIVQASYLLADPARWRAGLQHPDLFKGLMEADLKLLAGCEMLWVKDKEHSRFVGANDRKSCRRSRPGCGGRRLWRDGCMALQCVFVEMQSSRADVGTGPKAVHCRGRVRTP